MKSEHRGIIAIALSAGFFILWFTYLKPEQPPAAPAQAQEAATAQATTATGQATATATNPAPDPATGAGAADPAADPAAVHDPQVAMPVKTWTIETERIIAEFSTDGGVPIAWKLKGYRETTKAGSPLIDLAAVDAALPQPMALSFAEANFAFPERPRYELVAADDKKIVFRWRSAEAEVVKTIAFTGKRYLADVTVEVKNRGGKALVGRPALTWSGAYLPKEGGGIFGFIKQPPVTSQTPAAYIDGEVEREQSVAKIPERVVRDGQVYWSGLESRYFLGAIVPRVQGQGLGIEYGAAPATAGSPEGARGLYAGATLPKIVVPQGERAQALFSVYAGAKEIDDLKAAGARLEEAIDYGWFTIIAVPILYVLKFFQSIVSNWGIAIILLTILIKLLLHPINIKSLKSMKAMQQLQPRLKELQKKYKDDKARLNQETMQLFRAHKVNPMGGCLPMLAQFPIYIALYKVLWNSVQLYHAPFFWFYKDLSAPDPYLITPILLGIFMVAQQKLMPSASADPAQKKMMMIMPIMFTVFMVFLPVGLVIYILVNTVMSVTQQYMYNHGIGIMDLLRGKFRPAKAKA